MGGSKQTTTSEQKVQLPAWVNQGAQNVFNSASNYVANNPVTPYTGQLAAPTTANQNQASSMASATVNAGQADLDKARQLTSQAASGTYQPIFAQQFDDAAYQKYASPFAKAVQEDTLRQMDRSNAMQLEGVGDAAQAAKAFGGDRQAILEAELRRDQADARNSYINQSNEAAYNDAYSKFAADRAAQLTADQFNAGLNENALNRQLTAGAQYGQIGGQSGDLASRGIDKLTSTGLIDQETKQRLIDALYQEYLRQEGEPLDRYSQLAGILSGVPTERSVSGKETTQKSGGLLSTLLGAASIGASFI